MAGMPRRLFATFLITSAAFAAVTRVDVTERTQEAGYDRIVGKIYFAVDPKLSPNRNIADIDLGPRNAEGKVEFSSDLYMLRPHDPSKRNGTALVEISNRGGKSLGMFDIGDHFLLEQGFTLAWVGWEWDVPPAPGILRIDAPIATDHGKPIAGLVRSEWVGNQRVTTIPLGDREELGYPVSDPQDPANKLYVREAIEGERRLIPRDSWTFTDATHVSMSAGFEPGKIYEVVYMAKDPVLVGLGPAAVRDFVSYLKYGGVDTPIEDFHKEIRRTLGFGVSQSGRFLRTFLYDGFNQD
jgi:hypothetical protein